MLLFSNKMSDFRDQILISRLLSRPPTFLTGGAEAGRQLGRHPAV